jgi:hypothetical protein
MDALEQPLMELGADHASVGARPEHYPIVCRTMIEAMREASGGQWSPTLEQDWGGLLQDISRVMMAGALRFRRRPSSRNPSTPRAAPSKCFAGCPWGRPIRAHSPHATFHQNRNRH